MTRFRRKTRAPLNINISEESLQQVKSAYASQRETNNRFVKWFLYKNIAKRPLNIISILNNFKP